MSEIHAHLKILAKSVSSLEEQVNNFKKDSSDKFQKVSATSKENSSKLKNIQDENSVLKNNLQHLQIEINDKNGKIALLETLNTRLDAQNKNLIEICMKNNLFNSSICCIHSPSSRMCFRQRLTKSR